MRVGFRIHGDPRNLAKPFTRTERTVPGRTASAKKRWLESARRCPKYAGAKDEGDMPKTVRGKLVDFVLKLEEPRGEILVEMLAFAIENLTEAHGPEKVGANLRHIANELDENAKLKDVKVASKWKH
jgi:hypothetical protein